MTPLWSWTELCAALKLPVVDGPDIFGLSLDSRRIQRGDLFIALPGDPGPRFSPSQRSGRDGHAFIADAIAAGAAGILAHDRQERAVAQLQVPDTLDGLWDLGRAARRRLACPVVAVTGSSGKTTAKGFLAAALHGFASQGSLNNHLGVPLSLALTPRDAPAAVFEIGTNHPGEIAPLAELVQPDVAVVLNVHPAHIGNFSNLAQLVDEKLSIHKGLRETGWLVLEGSIDSGGLRGLSKMARFGTEPQCQVRLLDVHDDSARYAVRGRTVTARVPGGGGHRAMTLGAVICVLDILGRDIAPALNLPATLVPAGRGQVLEVGGITIIDDSYNANPVSMQAALESLALRPGRKIAVLGEMLELGRESARFHADLAEYCSPLDTVVCVGAGMRPLYEALVEPLRASWHANAGEPLIRELSEEVAPGDTLLVKGSNRVFWAQGFVSKLADALRAHLATP